MESKTFSTRELYLAATLVTLKFFVTNIDYQIEGEKQRMVGYFEFEDTPELREVEKKFWKGEEMLISPRMLFSEMRGLKSRTTNYYKSPFSEKK